jgi:competence protein ComEA
MIKKLLSVLFSITLVATAFAAVDVNTGDLKALQTINGLGPAIAKNILEERGKNGAFKSHADISARVKGLGKKKVEQLKKAGLVVGSTGGGAEKDHAKSGGKK